MKRTVRKAPFSVLGFEQYSNNGAKRGSISNNVRVAAIRGTHKPFWKEGGALAVCLCSRDSQTARRELNSSRQVASYSALTLKDNWPPEALPLKVQEEELAGAESPPADAVIEDTTVLYRYRRMQHERAM